MLPKMLNSSILHWSDGLSIAWRPNVTVPDKKAALSSLKGLEPRVTKWHHNQASGKLSNCKWGGKKNTQTIFSDNLLIDNSFQILNCFTNGVYIKARRCTMNGSIIVLGKTTFTYSLIFCEEKLDTFLTIGNSWLSDKINCCPWYPQFTAITVKCWHVFGAGIWTIFPPTGNVFRLDSSPETMFSTTPPQIQLLGKQTPPEENICWLRKQAIMLSVQLHPSSPTPFVQYLFRDIALNL